MVTFPQSIESQHLILRPLEAKDSTAFQHITDHPLITKAISFLKSPFTLQDAEAFIARSVTPRACFYRICLKDKTLIGMLGMHLNEQDEVEIGYWIGVDYQRHGYASEAVKAALQAIHSEMSGIEVFAECKPSNTISWKILTKAGFVDTHEEGERPGRRVLRWQRAA